MILMGDITDFSGTTAAGRNTAPGRKYASKDDTKIIATTPQI